MQAVARADLASMVTPCDVAAAAATSPPPAVVVGGTQATSAQEARARAAMMRAEAAELAVDAATRAQVATMVRLAAALTLPFNEEQDAHRGALAPSRRASSPASTAPTTPTQRDLAGGDGDGNVGLFSVSRVMTAAAMQATATPSVATAAAAPRANVRRKPRSIRSRAVTRPLAPLADAACALAAAAAGGEPGEHILRGRRMCAACGACKTPQWRAGPQGAKTLCNACGTRAAKEARLEARAALDENTTAI